MSRCDLFALGITIRELRKQAGLTLQAVADATGLSRSLLSKIENNRTVPSLPVLLRIAAALKRPVSELLRDCDAGGAHSYVLIRSDQRQLMERENREGYRYESIHAGHVGEGIFESIVLHLEGEAQGELIRSDGDMFVYCLSGSMYLQLLDEEIPLDSGDAIFFDGRTPHMSRHRGAGHACVLVIYLLQHERGPA